ncbi:hypothetical protein PtrM4_077840 [Pyrenophora tritici-repentis]|uniref:Reverse transcriptase n=1 Tax=Pyrenophora tritici-repentis TaxID=45151 RepID=A0A834RZN5_9PLEO|nr:hypothetical protein PtrM4_077840 [Pyrenophora tritici-repentis]
MAIVKAIKEITPSDIPTAKHIKTGWAITPRNDKIKALLMGQENRELMIRAVEGESARLPERWVNYAVQGVESSYRTITGESIPTTIDDIVSEALSQTGIEPASCRPSRHGPTEGRTTWIISFTRPVRSFRLFGTGDYAHEIKKNSPAMLHDPGCLGYCKTSRCTRPARCTTCSKTTATHQGPHGEQCKDTPKCANCHGPFPATHDKCPAAPTRVNGRLIQPIKGELKFIREAGDRASEAIQPARGRQTGSTVETSIEITDGDIANTTEPVEHLRTQVKEADKTEKGHSAPWWTEDCRVAYKRHIQEKSDYGQSPSEATRAFLATVRKAKRTYWQQRIDGCNNDKDLYKLVGWHKLSFDQRDTPLVIEGRTIIAPLEKAEALREAILDRFSAEDDLLEPPPLDNDPQTTPLPWDTYISMEETERYVIGVSSTSPGPDQVTVRLLKACWEHIRHLVLGIYRACMEQGHYPAAWRTVEVAMIPKVGKKDKSSPRSMRPIALSSCLGKGLERIIARRIAHTAMAFDILSPQHGGALPKRSAMDLATAFTHDVEMAWSRHEHVSMLTLDVQGAFDALLKNRLLHRMRQQGWPPLLRKFIQNFLSERRVRVRLGNVTTPVHRVACGTPQGSPLSPVLYTLYLAELLNQDRKLRFGYADDINLYRVSHSLDENVALLAEDLKSINEWGAANKITFAPEKRELIHLTRQKGLHAPPIQLEDQTIHPIALRRGKPDCAALAWGVKHVAERAAQARKVANHLRSLANTAHGPPAGSLRKAAITCILPILLYGAETWYEGRTKNPRIARVSRKPTVSTRVGWHLTTIDQALIAATKAILPAWRTTPNAVLLREAAMPSAQVALEEAKLRFAVHLRTIDDKHPLTNRTTLPLVIRGRAAGNRRIPRSKVQRVAQLLPATPRNVLASPHFSDGSRQDPTQGQGKDIAAQNFTIWWESLGQETITVFSDGSEQQINGTRVVTYGYAIYQGQAAVATGQGSLNALSHVFDAEAIGACRGLKHALQLSLPSQREIVLCIDSTSVIWGIRGAAPASSQWAFLQIHGAMEAYNVKTRWAPGHMKIVGNELADQLADNEAKDPHQPYGMAASPTRSGIRTVGRRLLEHIRDTWWKDKSSRLSAWYTQWQLPYDTRRTPAALWLPRRILAKVLMIRSTHGDFEWYHRKFNHEDTSECPCGRPKTPEHLVFCKRATTHFKKWPLRPIVPPRTRQEGLAYLAQLIDQPQEFETFVKVTNSFYDE